MKSALLHEDGGLRRYVLVMDEGDEAFAEITAFAADRGIRAASITAIGAARGATLGYFDPAVGDYVYSTCSEQVELASCVGDIAMGADGPALHAHVVLGRRDGTALAGHLRAIEVFPTMEVTLVESPAHLVKRIDPQTGLALIAIDAALDDEPAPADPSLPRGVNHIGLTVPDLDQATAFLRAAFGARVAYDGLTRDDEPRRGPDIERALGLPPGAAIVAQRMIRIGTGPGLEVFELEHTDPQPAAGLADLGWGHVSLLVDDLDAVLARATAAGGRALDAPHPNSRHEDTPGNASIYVLAPWGSIIELQTLPNGHWYGSGSETDVWSPSRRGIR
ncbi:DUF296 domain-containing protein [Galbitalea sp. SE-J8]|uniref:PCC domain-containing protein n=1 Tax=Galbitalea sp. SE-J8 TaxID=3054952 RepID=UPI00259D2D45|nr:DUF296 domain-containing protein [Galbitalea sp. SE-J8]MDM4762023.1 DUF296 domain-containing protein [Galbitalea sp. SE-J8]